MGVVTIAEVLERMEEFERMLTEFYAKLSQQSTREGVRLLTGIPRSFLKALSAANRMTKLNWKK